MQNVFEECYSWAVVALWTWTTTSERPFNWYQHGWWRGISCRETGKMICFIPLLFKFFRSLLGSGTGWFSYRGVGRGTYCCFSWPQLLLSYQRATYFPEGLKLDTGSCFPGSDYCSQVRISHIIICFYLRIHLFMFIFPMITYSADTR